MKSELIVGRIITLACLFLCGCQAMVYGTARDMNKLSVGMSRAEVVQVLGPPTSIAAHGQSEYFMYKKMVVVISEWPRDYFVKLEQGKVVSFGEKGDFDSTKNPTVDININKDVTVHGDPTPAQLPQTNLEKIDQLFKLRQSGAITEDEYRVQKARLLN